MNDSVSARPEKATPRRKTAAKKTAPTPTPTPTPDHPAEPYALVTTETVPMPYYRPVVQVMTPNPDGGETVERLECPHTTYLHENEKTALACGRRLAAQHKVRIGADR